MQPPATRIPDSWLAPAACHRRFITGPTALSCGVVAKRATAWEYRGYTPDHYSIVWCLRGSGRFEDHLGRTWDLGPGDLFHRFTDRPHSNRLDPDGGWVEAYIGFGAQLGTALMSMGVVDPERPVRHVGIDLILLRTLIQERDALRAASENDLLIRLGRLLALHQDLLAGAHRSDGQHAHDAAIDRACRRLADEPRVPLQALAQECGLSYERFRKVFRDRLGVSPHEYRIRRRIDQACTALRSDDLPIHAIASSLGYANPFQFSAQFKRLVGVSPATYRRTR